MKKYRQTVVPGAVAGWLAKNAAAITKLDVGPTLETAVRGLEATGEMVVWSPGRRECSLALHPTLTVPRLIARGDKVRIGYFEWETGEASMSTPTFVIARILRERRPKQFWIEAVRLAQAGEGVADRSCYYSQMAVDWAGRIIDPNIPRPDTSAWSMGSPIIVPPEKDEAAVASPSEDTRPKTVRDVACPTCRVRAGVICKRPSGHAVFGGESHADRAGDFLQQCGVTTFAGGSCDIKCWKCGVSDLYPKKSARCTNCKAAIGIPLSD